MSNPIRKRIVALTFTTASTRIATLTDPDHYHRHLISYQGNVATMTLQIKTVPPGGSVSSWTNLDESTEATDTFELVWPVTNARLACTNAAGSGTPTAQIMSMDTQAGAGAV